MSLPTIGNYGQGRTKQHNSTVVTVGVLTIYYSYTTPVAFRSPGFGLTVRENEWGPTTGKHLNWIDGGDKSKRVNGTTFVEMLARECSVTPTTLRATIERAVE